MRPRLNTTVWASGTIMFIGELMFGLIFGAMFGDLDAHNIAVGAIVGGVIAAVLGLISIPIQMRRAQRTGHWFSHPPTP